MKSVFSTFVYTILLFATPVASCSSSATPESKSTSGTETNTLPTMKALIVFVDDYVNEEDNAIAESVKKDFATVNRFLEVLNTRGIVKVEKTVLKGASATLAKFNETLNAMTTKPEDIVFIYFSGHGGMEEGKRTLLYFRGDEDVLYRDVLEGKINKMSAGFKMLITDACSNPVDGVMARSMRSMNTAKTGNFDEVYRTLFTKQTGFLSLSASSPNEYAWSDNEAGGYFTNYLINEKLLKNPSETWTENFENAKLKTQDEFRKMTDRERKKLEQDGIKSQTPIAYSLPKAKGGNPPKTDEVTPDSKMNIVISNNSGKNATIYIDNNNPDSEDWDETKLTKKVLKPAEKATFTAVTSVGFFQNDDYEFYDLDESTEFEILSDATGFYVEYVNADDETADDGEEIPFNELLIGTWTWEEAEDEYTAVFSKNFKYTLTDSEGSETGTWAVSTETDEEGAEYEVFSIKSKDADGVTIKYEYEIFSNGDDELQLIFLSYYENDEELEVDESELQDYDALLYRK